jgi:hypothetical protein
MNTTDRLTDEEIRRIVASYPAPAQDKVASVALEPEDVEIVRGALAGRRVIIGEDEVGFDKVTEARVTMRWTRPSPPVVERPDAKVVSGYDPYTRDRMPGYRGDGE